MGTILGILYVVGLVWIYSLCKMAAPQTDEEQRLDDEAQIKCLKEKARKRSQ